MNQLDQDMPLDTEDQEELVQLLRLDNLQTNKIFINIFSIIYLIPLPFFIHLKYCRVNSVASFLSILSLVLSLIKVRYLHFLNFQSIESSLVERVNFLFNSTVFNVLNLIISMVVILQRYDQGWDLNLIYYVPIIACISSILLMYWIIELDNDIDGLGKLKYKYKSA